MVPESERVPHFSSIYVFFVLFVWHFRVFMSFLSVFGHHVRSESKKKSDSGQL